MFSKPALCSAVAASGLNVAIRAEDGNPQNARLGSDQASADR